MVWIVLRATAMRHSLLAVIVALSGCTLYFDGESDDVPPPDLPDSGPHDWDGGPAGDRMVRCEDGKLYMVDFTEWGEQPPHGAGTPVGACGNGCKTAAVMCEGHSCPTGQGALCTAPVSTGKACGIEGTTCSGTATTECPQSTTCGYSVSGSTCTCVNGKQECTQRTDAAAVQAALVGKWRGIVRPPSFSAPYQVSLWIYSDGTYWGECAGDNCTAFYYGGDGPHPWRKISVLSNSPTMGAWADIGVFTSNNIGAISALVATPTKLTFTYNASWFNCGQPFYFDLTRE